jgi:glycosyltransferase involved in cell wall biosynthesis
MSYRFNEPVLATNMGGGVPDAVENYKTGLIVEPDSESIANGILWFKHHFDTRFSDNISKYTDEYMSWKGLCSQILKLTYNGN